MTIYLERARAIAWEHWPSSHDFPEREAAERAALVALTEAADEIASLRARVEAVETVAEEALDQLWHLAKDPNTNPLVLDLTAVLRTREEPARQALKDTPVE